MRSQLVFSKQKKKQHYEKESEIFCTCLHKHKYPCALNLIGSSGKKIMSYSTKVCIITANILMVNTDMIQ